jgi:hypothetical protein
MDAELNEQAARPENVMPEHDSKAECKDDSDTDKASAILLEFMSEMKGWENKFATRRTGSARQSSED